jgi:hypothetical protein
MDKRLRLGDVLILVGFLVVSLLVASAPLVLGVVVVALVPGLGGLRSGVTPIAVVGVTTLAVVLGMVFSDSIERAARRPFGIGTLAAEGTSLGLVWLLILPIMVEGWSASLATSIGSVLYKCVEPLLDRWDRSEPAVGEDHARRC